MATIENPPTMNQKPSTKNHQPTILQFGGGVFLRAFVGSFVEEANTRFQAREAIAIVERSRSAVSELLAQEQYRYTVVTEGIVKGENVRESTRIHAVAEMLAADTDWARVLEIVASEEVHVIISNATESGIVFDESDVGLITSGLVPQSFPGKLTACLHPRWKAGSGASKRLYILPTELIENNAMVLHSIVVSLAEASQFEQEFFSWLEEDVQFCNTLVDRIVPGTPDKNLLQEYSKWLGYTDEALVTTEPYRLWAIEGDESVKAALSFASCKGVVVKPDISEERTLKVRILNAGHTLMAPHAMGQGLETVLQAMNHAEISQFIEKALRTEVALTLDYEAEKVQNYISEVLDRFRNPFLQHKLSGIRKGEEVKFAMRIQPTIDAYRKKFGREPMLLLHSN
jgi:tagaturonate reductase